MRKFEGALTERTLQTPLSTQGLRHFSVFYLGTESEARSVRFPLWVWCLLNLLTPRFLSKWRKSYKVRASFPFGKPQGDITSVGAITLGLHQTGNVTQAEKQHSTTRQWLQLGANLLWGTSIYLLSAPHTPVLWTEALNLGFVCARHVLYHWATLPALVWETLKTYCAEIQNKVWIW